MKPSALLSRAHLLKLHMLALPPKLLAFIHDAAMLADTVLSNLSCSFLIGQESSNELSCLQDAVCMPRHFIRAPAFAFDTLTAIPAAVLKAEKDVPEIFFHDTLHFLCF